MCYRYVLTFRIRVVLASTLFVAVDLVSAAICGDHFDCPFQRSYIENVGAKMPHDADFADAHRRHWEDAELLYGHERWANTDQLYGFSAECGLKAVMRSLGMPAETDPGETVSYFWSLFGRQL